MSQTITTKFDNFTNMEVLVKAFQSLGWQDCPVIGKTDRRMVSLPENVGAGSYRQITLVPQAVQGGHIALQYDIDHQRQYEKTLGQNFDILKEAYSIENTREYVQLKMGTMVTENLTNGVVRATVEIEVYE